MAITVPNAINNISNSQIITQSGKACIPANLLDDNFQALANPVNPVIPVTSNISLSIVNSGNIYRLDAPTANSTIILPIPTNGFNTIFVCNNSSSYTYTFSTPGGNIIWNNTSSTNVTPNTTSGVYFLVSDGTNYILNSYSDITGVTTGTYGNATNVPQITVDSKGRITNATTIGIAVVPTGSVLPYAGSSAPTGYLLCQGQAVSRTTYANLYTVIGTTYGGGDGSTTFNVPNLQSRVPVGLNTGDTNFSSLGKMGGEESHTLTINEIPSHSHTYPDGVNATGTDGLVAGGSVTGTGTTSSVGSGWAHNNLQPYITLNFIIKT
jgi:microcystin-dependent protein